ncbi:30S ribosomal protein S1 [Planctomyces sp. SH-PL14]|uniref:30S ribosomal protein S1 n=1 Tax=Planctomyces sp. SH-PL14 TaxID=1632864 RepID=UPI00078CC7C1|nr:S1 RNA-binding domain-containing protein [Planctomyces sp. SH-PL14]AMV21946.1 30S ribosomal protein S1 [Planctomyces sp. SH-PL14]
MSTENVPGQGSQEVLAVNSSSPSSPASTPAVPESPAPASAAPESPATPPVLESQTPADSNGAPANPAAAGVSSNIPATETLPSNDEKASDDEKRRPRLNPSGDASQFKAIPSLNAGQPGDDQAVEAEVARIAAVEKKIDAPPTPRQKIDLPPSEDLDQQTEAEIAAAMGGAELPTPTVAEGQEPPQGELTEKTRVNGTIESIRGDDVFVNIGHRLGAVASLRQFNPKKPPQVGDKVDLIVFKVDEEAGLIQCNLPRASSRVSGDWDSVSPGQVVECMVTKTNKGGLDITVGSLRGFLPASQADVGYVANLESLVGQKITAKVTEVNPARRRLVVSRRQLLMEEREVASKELMQTLQVGDTRTGRVKTIKDFGAFIDLGGVDGFLHVGQISWVRINHPKDVLQEGQTVEVKVLTIDPETKKISLGMRQLASNPWANAEDKYAKGSNVTGRVSRVEPFGAFVELEPGMEGLIHISELDHKRIKRVTEVVDVGQMVEVQVLEVDPGRKRISLSAKALKEKPADQLAAEAAAAAPEPAHVPRRPRNDLKGGIGGQGRGGLFGNPRDFQ